LQRVTSAEKVRWNAVASEFNCLNENETKQNKRESEMQTNSLANENKNKFVHYFSKVER
jgi:hypothetical protein